ncbi:hypothetical protein [Methylomarinum vadi]|uniref:hypothetical protein n=1 Tax=Methylomarinum vadi TaxID=438855 RepID=UPI0006892BCA|nr:hypothetical protein [Methylomarinum vadi]
MSGKYGQYAAWPEDVEFSKPAAVDKASEKLITATAIGKHFDLSPNKMNYILSELGWIKKGLKGWLVTDQGAKVGAQQGEDSRSGIPYARWPEKILSGSHALRGNPVWDALRPEPRSGSVCIPTRSVGTMRIQVRGAGGFE